MVTKISVLETEKNEIINDYEKEVKEGIRKCKQESLESQK